MLSIHHPHPSTFHHASIVARQTTCLPIATRLRSAQSVAKRGIPLNFATPTHEDPMPTIPPTTTNKVKVFPTTISTTHIVVMTMMVTTTTMVTTDKKSTILLPYLLPLPYPLLQLSILFLILIKSMLEVVPKMAQINHLNMMTFIKSIFIFCNFPTYRERLYIDLAV